MSSLAGSVDTNAILRLLLNDIPAQRNAVVRLVEQGKGRQFAVADIALFETAFILRSNYEFTRTEIVDALQDFMSLRHFNCNRVLFTRALELYGAHSSLSLEDCALATYAELNDASPLYTFDKKLATQVSAVELIASA